MSEETDKYLFNDIYDEAFADSDNEEIASESPLCDTLKAQKSQYADMEKIASGGMKVVYKAFDKNINRYVAYAALHKDCPLELYDPFIREARLTALLEHPNIINVYEIGLNKEGIPFFTMELKAGKNLAEVIGEKSAEGNLQDYDMRPLLEAYLKVCDAIAYAHSKKVVHLDLKPDNIQMGSFGEVIVCDWGLGEIIGDKDIEYDHLLFNPDLLNNVTLTDTVTGTPGYMAPEQILNNRGKNERTDIYSLGAMLYTVLTGKCAFEGSVEEVLDKTVRGKFRAPNELQLNWQVPESLNAVVMKAMSLEQSDRYASAEELRSEVQNFLQHKTTIAENAGLWKEAKLFYKRNLLICNIIGAALFTISLLGTIFLVKLQQKNVSLATEKNRAEESFKKAETEKVRYKEALDSMFMQKNLATAMLRGEFDLLYRTFLKVDSEVFHKPVEALEDAESLLLKVSKDSQAYDWAQVQLSHIHYLRQDFHTYNVTSLEDEEVRITDVLAKEIALLKSESELAPIDKLRELIETQLSFQYMTGTVLKMIKYDGAVRQSKKEHSELVEILLRKKNKAWEGGFKYEKESQKLTLTGRNFFRLSLNPEELYMRGKPSFENVSMIDSLPIKVLDISGTGVQHLWAVKDLSLRKLIIKDVNFNDLKPLKYMGTLKKLIISKGDFTKEELTDVPGRIEVIEE